MRRWEPERRAPGKRNWLAALTRGSAGSRVKTFTSRTLPGVMVKPYWTLNLRVADVLLILNQIFWWRRRELNPRPKWLEMTRLRVYPIHNVNPTLGTGKKW